MNADEAVALGAAIESLASRTRPKNKKRMSRRPPPITGVTFSMGVAEPARLARPVAAQPNLSLNETSRPEAAQSYLPVWVWLLIAVPLFAIVAIVAWWILFRPQR